MGRPLTVAVYELDADSEEIAVVRCPPGDVDAFWRLTVQHIREHELLFTEDREGWSDREWMAVTKARIRPPHWRWCRKNAAGSGKDREQRRPWILGHPDGPGQGNWQGAIVHVTQPDDNPEPWIRRGFFQTERKLVSVA